MTFCYKSSNDKNNNSNGMMFLDKDKICGSRGRPRDDQVTQSCMTTS